MTPSPADRRDARAPTRIGFSAGLHPRPAAVLAHRGDMSSGLCAAVPRRPPRWPAPAPAEASARCEGGSATRPSARPVDRTALRVAMLDRQWPRPEVVPCFLAATGCGCGCGGGAGLRDGLRPGVVHGLVRMVERVLVRPGSPCRQDGAGHRRSMTPGALRGSRGRCEGAGAAGYGVADLLGGDVRWFGGPDLEVRRRRKPREVVKPQSVRVCAVEVGQQSFRVGHE